MLPGGDYNMLLAGNFDADSFGKIIVSFADDNGDSDYSITPSSTDSSFNVKSNGTDITFHVTYEGLVGPGYFSLSYGITPTYIF